MSQLLLSVFQIATSTPIAGVGVAIMDSTDTALVTSATTNSVGLALSGGGSYISIADGTYKVRLTQPGGTFVNPSTLVVSGDTTVSLYGSPASTPSSSTNGICRLYAYLVNGNGTPLAVEPRSTFEVINLPFESNGTTFVGTRLPTVFSTTTGLMYVDVPRGSTVRAFIVDIVPVSEVIIPDVSGVKLGSLLT